MTAHEDPAFAPLRLLAADGAAAALIPHGAHLLSWIPAGGDERLFLSTCSETRAGVAVRGGVPVIFPQFASEGPLPKHGFARTALWSSVDQGRDETGAAWARFALGDSAATRAIWPNAFEAQLRVTVGGPRLDIVLEVLNTDRVPFAFTAALHGYFRVGDVGRMQVRGLEGLEYRDSAAGGLRPRETGAALHFAGEVDRIYLEARQPALLAEGATPVLQSAMEGFTDLVIWNPGAAKGAALSDLEPQGERRFVCLEAAVIGRPVQLAPGACWRGVQRLEAL